MIHGKSPFKPKEKYDNKETEKDEYLIILLT